MAAWKRVVAREMLNWMVSAVGNSHGHGGMTASSLLRRCMNNKPDLMKGVTEEDVDKYLSDELKLDSRK